MTSDLSPRERLVLDGYLARMSATPKIPPVPEDDLEPDPAPSILSGVFSVDGLVLRGNDNFYDESKNVGQKYKGIPVDAYVGVPVSLEKCLAWTRQNKGIVATLPYLVAGLSVAPPKNYLRQRFHTCFSEEFSGVDTEGVYDKGKPIVVVQHGIDLLLPERIRKAYNEGLTQQNGAKLTPEEWKKVLLAKNPLYTVDDVKKSKVKNPFGSYRVVLSFDTAKATSSNYQDKNTFTNNELVIARAGTLEHLEKYFDNIQSGNTVGNGHKFGEIDPRFPQGRVLFVYDNDGGLVGVSNLNNCARFVGVAPEAQSSTKLSRKGRAKK